MKLGLGTYCYMWAHGVPGQAPREPLTAFGLLERCIEMGVRVVQFGPNLPLDEENVDALAARAREAGVEVEIGVAGLDAATMERGVALCGRMGATLLRTVDQYEGPARSAEELSGLLRAALPLLERGGVRLGLENSRTPARTVARALDEIGSPQVGVTLDTVNSLAVPEGTLEVVEALARHTVCLHVKDFRVKRSWHSMGFAVEGTPAGQGQLDIPRLLRSVADAGRDPNAILELWVEPRATVEETVDLEAMWVRESVEYMRRLIVD